MKRIYLFVCLLLIPALISIIYFDVLGGKVKKTNFLYDKDGNMIASSPFPPGKDYIFGVDRNSRHMAYEVLSGYRITLGILIIVAIITLIIAILIGTYLAFKKTNLNIFESFMQPFFYIPQSILGYLLLRPILYEPIDQFTTTQSYRIIFNLIILIVLMLPTTILLVKSATQMILEKEFISSARTMSPSKAYIFKKHLLPNMLIQYFIVFFRIMFQTLVVISHLAFFKILFGGTDVCYGPGCLINEQPTIPELSSLLGFHFYDLQIAWWTFYAPLLAIIYILFICQYIYQRLDLISLK
ncbi:ABC transporter permease subunit [Macrococcus animalis]|uniref:ABC transporter permease subunit n=1 Tax=Macrococcus animalis TaxID=3395467 RepID=UPI0039BE8786